MRQGLRTWIYIAFLVSCSVAFSPPFGTLKGETGLGCAHSSKLCRSRPRVDVTVLRKPDEKPVALRLPPLSCAKQDGGRLPEGENPELAATRVKQWPLVRNLVAFGKWLLASFRSLLVMRLSWLLHATSKIKHALLDTKAPLENQAAVLPAEQQSTTANSAAQGGTPSTAPEQVQKMSDEEKIVTPAEVQKKMFDIEKLMNKQPDPTVEVACQSFWDSLNQGTPSVETTLAKLQEESAKMKQQHALELQNAAGVHLSVLDFVLDGGMPPSVEALTAWLQYRGIDTNLWGKGEAKTVQDFFHEIWAGECEPLSDQAQRCISVVKVRILDEDDKGTWQLYETKQKFCRDGRTRPRNKPLAEKKRPRETPEETAVRGIYEELGSVLDQDCAIDVNGQSLEEWVECRHSNSFPGLETVYKLYQIEVKVEGLTRARTGTAFESLEAPNLSTGKVHSWTWKPSGGVDWQPVDPAKGKADAAPASPSPSTAAAESPSDGPTPPRQDGLERA